ncbi:MAG: hypothetical protein PF589_03805 [Gammaproteobacteria bacterium]|jgi:hypothetical protein|nr:hypothetical protein [Gammaproteobacteria bacterium]
MLHNNEKLQHVIDHICANGCEHVKEVIEILERHENSPETSPLSAQETELVLLELKAIMAVYEQK